MSPFAFVDQKTAEFGKIVVEDRLQDMRGACAGANRSFPDVGERP